MTDTHTTDHRWQPPAQAAITALLNRIAFNDRGLVPAIAQDATSAKVLMLAWMNRTALAETLSTGRVCYWSRSRGQLWRKGEQSGHHQYLHDIRYDCDDDAILLLVHQIGVACHTGAESCFFGRIETLELTSNS